ncbi:MAG: Phage-related protein [Pseudoduganella sp.]|jgi:HK97 family phage portal protein|nr:Phage-related protein [Pseudoduganella sp.]
MTAKLLNLEAARHDSRVLGAWIAQDAGRGARAGVQAFGENSSQQLNVDELANLLGAANRSVTGYAVTEDTAMRVSAVYACVSLIAGAIASLPVGIFKREGNERSAADHDYWWMFNELASDGWTAFDAWNAILTSKLLSGDGLGELIRPNKYSNRVIGWKPIPRANWTAFRNPKNRAEVLYLVSPEDGSPSYVLTRDDVIHLKSPGYDGLTSPSPITYAARDAIGTALASQDYTGKFFAGGGNFDYALKTAAKLDKTQQDMLKASLIARAQTGGRGPLILTGGLEPAQLSVNAKDAEVQAAKLFTVEEICSILGVPPYMIGHTTKATSFGTGIEQQGIGFVRYTLQRHLTPVAQELNSKLWPTRERYFVEHITDALVAADMKARYESYRIALGRAGEQPFMTTDEVRRKENLAPNADLNINQGANDAAPTDQTASE